ncbi:hypothetical protein BJX63DRAFT_405263 [Aspergillus granulosus]|uniref:Uncharacterized protein n=1 Tax=Aspergillus granulosus TaxID=176169 RepID=A0ABR4H229_9EURO
MIHRVPRSRDQPPIIERVFWRDDVSCGDLWRRSFHKLHDGWMRFLHASRRVASRQAIWCLRFAPAFYGVLESAHLLAQVVTVSWYKQSLQSSFPSSSVQPTSA